MLKLEPPLDDGLLIPEVGKWSHEKHHFLIRYVDAITTAMRKKRWSGLHYVDLFAGAGIERLQGTDKLDWGSPVIAAHADFDQLHLCEKDEKKYQALHHRVRKLRPNASDHVVCGDANDEVSAIVEAIPAGALTLAFLDPYGLHLDYETLRSLADVPSDLVIFFPDRLDVIRNWQAYYWENPNSNLDAVLGSDANWRATVYEAPQDARLRKFLDLYVAQIKKLGYEHFEWEPIPGGTRSLYKLIYCTRSEAGIRIWRRVSEKKPNGQRTFDFPGSH